MREAAILMAAGLGTRMRPITESIPKPLVPVKGKPMIETVIEGLLSRNVEEIYVVTGYLKEQFMYLPEKYSQVRLIHNPDYAVKNNISSIYAARDVLDLGNCFICESDLYIADTSLFEKDLTHSCYFAKWREGYTDDWVFTVDKGRIVRVGKGGKDTYQMVGIAYFMQAEARMLKEAIQQAYDKEENKDLFWDDVVDRNLDRLPLKVELIKEGQLVEIDTVEELEKINESI